MAAKKVTPFPRSRNRAPLRVEALEARTLLALLGGAWPHPERITVSFMPDGTDPRTLNLGTSETWAKVAEYGYDAALFKKEALRGLQMWAHYANINFVLVDDDGSPSGSAGSTSDYNVQGDVDFGDIRIGFFDLGEGLFGLGTAPPPRADTEAGDIWMNSYYMSLWNPEQYMLSHMMAHEAGHALGLGHNSTSDVMSGVGIPDTMTPEAEDIADLQSLYGPRQHDVYDQSGRGVSMDAPINVTNKLDEQFRYTFNGLDITTPTDRDWFKIRIPDGAGPKLLVRMHTTQLSLLAPRLVLYDAQGNQLQALNGDYGETITIWQNVQPGEVYYIKATGRGTDEFSVGAYALMVRVSDAPLLPVEVPDTATPVDPNAQWGIYDPALAPGADIHAIEQRLGLSLHDHSDHEHSGAEFDAPASTENGPHQDSVVVATDVALEETDVSLPFDSTVALIASTIVEDGDASSSDGNTHLLEEPDVLTEDLLALLQV